MMSELLQPIHCLDVGLSTHQISKLVEHGIVTLGQLYETLQKKADFWIAQGVDETTKARCLKNYQSLKQNVTFGNSVALMPPLGWVLDPKDSPKLMQHREETRNDRLKLANVAKALKDQLPDEFLLTEYMQPVRNQAHLGACTGFGSTSAREFLDGVALSPGFAYRGAKMLDGMPDVEGSYQEYCYQFFVKYGQLFEHEYDYDKCLCDEDIGPYLPDAKRFKIHNYLDLIVPPEHLSLVLKAALCGQLDDDISARPVSISVAVYESFLGDSARRFGLIPVPYEGDTLCGGHALSVCGFVQLYDICYFVVQNSWGTSWAS